LSSQRKTVCNILGSFDFGVDPKIVAEFLRERLESMPSIRIHPDQKLAIGPTEKMHRNEAKSPQAQGKYLHRG
jgi:hypothetical protein